MEKSGNRGRLIMRDCQNHLHTYFRCDAWRRGYDIDASLSTSDSLMPRCPTFGRPFLNMNPLDIFRAHLLGILAQLDQ